MILDTLDHCSRYRSIHPSFKQAFDFIQIVKNQSFQPRKEEVLGNHIIAIIEASEGRTRQMARLEAHRKYIDIQYTFNGEEEIGWRALQECKTISEIYNPEKDIQFFSDIPNCWLPIPQGSFAIFFPEDAHAPLAIANNQYVQKIIMKVAI